MDLSEFFSGLGSRWMMGIVREDDLLRLSSSLIYYSTEMSLLNRWKMLSLESEINSFLEGCVGSNVWS